MTFSSITFFVFFAVVYSLILIFNMNCIRNKLSEKVQLNLKHTILLVSSYVFYGWWDWRFCFLMFILTLIAWYCTRMVDMGKRVKLHTTIGIVVPLVVLGFFKYFNFFVDSFAHMFGIENHGTLSIILPVGISFYTFQSMSYTIDVVRKNIKSSSFKDVALYVSFFPQLVAGPIVKASDFIPQLKSNHKLKLDDFSEGIQIFVFGLFKKLVIADNLSVFVDAVFEKPLAYSSISVILAVISYSIQIYCDFSGYSDMAIGTARCFGYRFAKNFNMPYISKNVSEFWKRWHISLSSWLQEYLYIPLGGNRKGARRTYINLMLTMVLGGLWHGASYTFIWWGFLHGLALCIHKLYRKYIGKSNPAAIGSILSILVTYIFVCICWVFFRAENFTVAKDVICRMFIWKDGINHIFSWTVFSVAIMLICHIVPHIKNKEIKSVVNGYYPILNLNKISHLIIFFTVIMFIICTAYTNSNPFIYFQF